ncbi:hypothetical protein SNK03_002526 [Fusarium graminearum]|uniref:hypothetical protein n=1 Tax=Gibberella zeae (strain ATCC MYA-4620 / CBS 123657 / FGSC 9075 / NRRL 31084 / PH-1) TaxID=229533 RepID=UPI00021F15C2|nr:hypothetical protein FGSG_12085 [Fusarium graminearum PH-1]ESU07600.1 hypothetical protein FGSG_12085 [Fusarium graminearum PH-1]|eukprot:XP_011318085.1 hypothetical protein FGSG_12085 [Fusarium graminearum PH-1]
MIMSSLSFAAMLGYASYIYHKFRKGTLISQFPASATDQLVLQDTSNAGHPYNCIDQHQQPLTSLSTSYSHDKHEMSAYEQPLTELDGHHRNKPYAGRSELFAAHTPATEIYEMYTPDTKRV